MGQDPVRGTVQLPDNEGLARTLSKSTQRKYEHLKQSALEVAKDNPNRDTRVLTRYLGDYLNAVSAEEQQVKGEMQAVNAKKPNMNWVQLRDETDKVNKASERRYNQFLGDFHKNTVPQYGVEGEEAWKELHHKMHGPSIVGAAANQIYDKKKGGMQWGGLVGLILGGLMATQLTGGLMTGELVPILATVGAAFLGAWLGNKAVDGVSNMLKPDAPAPQAARAPSQGVTAPAQDMSPKMAREEADMRESIARAEANKSLQNQITIQLLGSKDRDATINNQFRHELAKAGVKDPKEIDQISGNISARYKDPAFMQKSTDERMDEIRKLLTPPDMGKLQFLQFAEVMDGSIADIKHMDEIKKASEKLSEDVKKQATEAVTNPPPGSTTQPPAKPKDNTQGRGGNGTPR